MTKGSIVKADEYQLICLCRRLTCDILRNLEGFIDESATELLKSRIAISRLDGDYCDSIFPLEQLALSYRDLNELDEICSRLQRLAEARTQPPSEDAA